MIKKEIFFFLIQMVDRFIWYNSNFAILDFLKKFISTLNSIICFKLAYILKYIIGIT